MEKSRTSFMKKTLWKRNAVAAAVLLFVCAAIFLNGRYTEQVEETDADKILGQSTLVSGETEADGVPLGAAQETMDYFASARLTRQQARDNALSLLRESSEGEAVDAVAATEAAAEMQVIAGYTLTEAQIENMVTAKGYTDCVAFMSTDSVSVVVSTNEDGLQTEDVAKITDIVKQETGFSANCIKILEVN